VGRQAPWVLSGKASAELHLRGNQLQVLRVIRIEDEQVVTARAYLGASCDLADDLSGNPTSQQARSPASFQPAGLPPGKATAVLSNSAADVRI
jgi:hypothetical protein